MALPLPVDGQTGDQGLPREARQFRVGGGSDERRGARQAKDGSAEESGRGW